MQTKNVFAIIHFLNTHTQFVYLNLRKRETVAQIEKEKAREKR